MPLLKALITFLKPLQVMLIFHVTEFNHMIQWVRKKIVYRKESKI